MLVKEGKEGAVEALEECGRSRGVLLMYSVGKDLES